MTRSTTDQLAFAASKQRSMARDEAIEFLRTMDIKYTIRRARWSAAW